MIHRHIPLKINLSFVRIAPSFSMKSVFIFPLWIHESATFIEMLNSFPYGALEASLYH